MAPTRYRTPPQVPPVFTATPSSIIEDSKRLIQESKSLLDSLAKDVSPEQATFKNVLLPMAHDENDMGLSLPILGFYQAVSTEKPLRDASTEADKLFEEYGIESSMREDIFKLVDGAFNAKEELDSESQRLLEKERKSYIQNGLGIPAGPKRDRFKEIKDKLSKISIDFSKALNEENGGLWFTEKELEGVPQDVIDTLKKGEGEDEGKYWLTFKYPDYVPTVKYAKDPKTREKVLVANENKLNSNVPLFRETILLRDEKARLLGYQNHAAFRIEDKMAKDPKVVDDFLNDLRTKLVPGGLQELERLKAIKVADSSYQGTKDDRFYLWDFRYYDRLLLEQEYQLDQQKISEYFPLSSTIEGMLKIFEELMGLVFVEITGEERDKIAPTGKGDDLVWHKDVQIFSVWDDADSGSGFVGFLYFDLFPREGKYGHAANFNIQPGFIRKDGTRHYPCTALVCNFSKPTPKKPSLLKHDEVVTLFHELGHGVHDLVAKTTYSRFHGTRTVQDFVEAPSQMLENWCWTASQLRSLSKHYSYLSPEYKQAYLDSLSSEAVKEQPSENIPDELIGSIQKTKHVNDAIANLRQLHFGMYDMKLHEPSSHEELEAMDFSELYNEMRHDISKLDGPESLGQGNKWGHGEATFGHLMGGYDSGYYGYLYSQVYSTDMFVTVFDKDPMNKEEGRRYRHMVLEKGGGQDEMKTLEDFLGRKPSTEAFYKDLGIA